MKKKIGRIKFNFNILLIGCILIVLFIVIGILEYFLNNATPLFFGNENILKILIDASVLTIISIGMTFIIITSGIDLSVGASLALSNVSIVLLMLALSGTEGYLQILAGIFIGLISSSAVGFANGYIIVKGKIPPFIVTLGMFAIVKGLTLYLDGSRELNLSSEITPTFSFIGNGSFLSIPFPIFTAVLIAVIFHIILNNTRFGRYTIATGANEEATRLSGINTDKHKLIVYAIGGFLVGTAGVIQTSRFFSYKPDIGSGIEFYTIAAVILGGTSFAGGKGSVFGTLFGVLIISVLNNGLSLMNVSDAVNQMIFGLIIIVVVLWDRFRKK